MGKFEFFIYNNRGFKENVDETHFLWNKNISKGNFFQKFQNGLGKAFTYGDYFKISSKVLSKRNFKLLLDVIKIRASLGRVKIKSVFIFLEKHGVFYHPSRVLVDCFGFFFTFNLSISYKGINSLNKEVISLNFTNDYIPFNYLIKLYIFAFNVSVIDYIVSFFMSDWLDGYKEFHLLDFQENLMGGKKIISWEYCSKNCVFSSSMLSKIFFQVSIILFSYYDLISMRSVSFWHNASGDFIFKKNSFVIDVRMVSIKKFDTISLNFSKKRRLFSENTILYGLLVFFLQNSLRIRLDRLFGTGSLFFLNKVHLYSVVKGFFSTLSILACLYNFPQYFPDFFRIYFVNYNFFDLKQILSNIVFKTYGRKMYDVYVILPKINEHVFYLKDIIRKIT